MAQSEAHGGPGPPPQAPQASDRIARTISPIIAAALRSSRPDCRQMLRR